MYSKIYDFKFGQQNNEFQVLEDPNLLKMTIKDYLKDFKSCQEAVEELFEKFGGYHEEDLEEDKKLMLLSTTKIFFEKYQSRTHDVAFLQSKKKILVAALKAIDAQLKSPF